MTEEQQLKELIQDQEWRLDNLYKVANERGEVVNFVMRPEQRHLFRNKHCYNVILKARQLGFSTFILIYMLDTCLFNSNNSAGVIAHTREDSEELFKNKIKFAYDKLPDWLKELRGATQDSAKKLQFSNGSAITVGTSLRGGTFQQLHISEYGKIAARYPEKAREIKTGALNTVHAGQEIFIESTAEGNQGEFYEICQIAQRLHHQKKTLTPLDPKLFFFPWYGKPSYALDAEVSINVDMQEYFAKLPVDLKPEQKAWYIKKTEQQGEDMKREFPSTPREAFEQSMEGAIYSQQMALVRKGGQIKHLPHEPAAQVYTFWDLGKGSDYTAIWFFQHIGNEYRFINYHESWNEGWAYYAKLLNSFPYVYAEHLLPHDGATKTAGINMSSAKQDLEKLGVRPISIVPRTKDMWQDIKGSCKSTLPRCSFDERNCAKGIKHLDNYRKEWDDRLSQWKEKPRHDDASHCADAFRTFVMGYKPRQQEFIDYTERNVYADSDYDMLNY